MSAPKKGRRRQDLDAKSLAAVEASEALVKWIPIVSFDRPAPETDPPGKRVDHGDQPYEPGPSLIDRERRGSFSVEFTYNWSGGVTVHASDGKKQVDLMLDRAQFYRLIEGGRRFLAGNIQDWLSGEPTGAVTCDKCEGSGFLAGQP